ncbi:MAG: hypothetical protein HPY45_05730 [Anaerolineae bacterium]|nr:hypothetical protein [Anaerolineae bacterium]
MRITQDLILRMARDYVNKQANADRTVACVYLTGSIPTGDFFIGNTTDVDLVFVHTATPPCKREVLPLTDELHLDVAHIPQSLFSQPRQQRTNPWIGSFLCLNPIVLYDTLHWFEFTQAAVCAQFDRPEYVLQRARPLAEEARQIWLDLYTTKVQEDNDKVYYYLKALERAANAIAILSGAPLTERRFMLNFPERARRINRPGLAEGLVDLFMETAPSEDVWQSWLNLWREAFSAAAQDPRCPPNLQGCRKLYYERTLISLYDDHPAAALWVMLRTWSLAAHLFPEIDSISAPWQQVSHSLRLSGSDFDEQRVKALDAYLDSVEETLDTWSKQAGV